LGSSKSVSATAIQIDDSLNLPGVFAARFGLFARAGFRSEHCAIDRERRIGVTIKTRKRIFV